MRYFGDIFGVLALDLAYFWHFALDLRYRYDNLFALLIDIMSSLLGLHGAFLKHGFELSVKIADLFLIFFAYKRCLLFVQHFLLPGELERFRFSVVFFVFDLLRRFRASDLGRDVFLWTVHHGWVAVDIRRLLAK